MVLREDEPAHAGKVTHLKNKAGRIFPVTDQLLKRNDMTPCSAPGKPAQKRTEGFQLSKATKQTIHDKGIKDFGVDISMDQGVTDMRAEFKAAAEGKANAEKEVLEVSKIAEQAMEEFGIVLDTDVSLEEAQNSLKTLQGADEDFLNNIRESQKNDQDEDNESEDNNPDAGSDDPNEGGNSTDNANPTADGSDSNPDNKE